MSAAARGRSDARDAPNSPRKNNAEGSKPSSPVTKGSARKLHVTGSSKKRETQRELARVGWKKLVKWKGSMGGKTLLQVRSLWCFNLPQMFVLIDSNQIPQIPQPKKNKNKNTKLCDNVGGSSLFFFSSNFRERKSPGQPRPSTRLPKDHPATPCALLHLRSSFQNLFSCAKRSSSLALSYTPEYEDSSVKTLTRTPLFDCPLSSIIPLCILLQRK